MLTVVIRGTMLDARNTIEEANKLADALEFRLDLLEEIDLTQLSALREAAKIPVIFTLRSIAHGGSFQGSEKERETQLDAALSLRPDFVDIEWDAPFVSRIDVPLICSYHNTEETPSNLEAILEKMQRIPATFYKLSTYAQSPLDALRMLLFVKETRQKGIPISGMCMGTNGGLTRILARVVDSQLTYAPLSEEGITASGQLTVSELARTYRIKTLSTQSKVYALIGDPVESSIGHQFHNAHFQRLSQDAVYVKISIKPYELSTFFALISNLPFFGLSVTMPLKELVAPYLEEIDPEAREIGAINTLVKETSGWKGFNTDAAGALDALESKTSVKKKRIVIIGAGGVAKAIAYEAIKRGAEIKIVNRSERKALNLAEKLKAEGEKLEAFEQDPSAYDILVNTTPVSTECPISKTAIHPKSIVFDVITRPKNTPLLEAAQAKGCTIISGYELFKRQASKQLELWDYDLKGSSS